MRLLILPLAALAMTDALADTSIEHRLRASEGRESFRDSEIERRLRPHESWRCIFNDDGSIHCRIEPPKVEKEECDEEE